MVAGATKALGKLAVEGAQQVVKSATKRGGRKAATTVVKKTTQAAAKKVAPVVPTKGIEEQITEGLAAWEGTKFGGMSPQEKVAVESHWRRQQASNLQPEIETTNALYNSQEAVDSGALDEFSTGIRGFADVDQKVKVQKAAYDQASGKTPVDPAASNKLALDSFIAENQVDLASAPRGQMMTVQGMQEVPMYPGTKEDLLPKIKEYIKLQQATGSKAPKGGWEKIFGHVADEEGNPLRITGGVKESKPARWQKHNMPSRKFAESLFSEGEDSARLKIMSAQKNQKHHAEWAIKESEIFGTTDDGVARSAEDLDYIDSEIKRRFGIDFGNKDAQEIAQSQRAHMGVKGDEASLQLASHRILDNISDVQGFRDWQFEASDIKFEMPLRKNQKTPTVKWFKNKDGIIYTAAKGQKEGKAIGDMAAFKKKYPNSTPVAFRMPGTAGGTYSPVQRHGFSQELIETIRKLHDPEDVIKAIGLFKESGVGELRKGASALATTLLEKHDIDPKTASWVSNNMDQALEVAGIMKQQPGVKEIPEFQNFMNYMEEIQRAVKGKNY